MTHRVTDFKARTCQRSWLLAWLLACALTVPVIADEPSAKEETGQAAAPSQTVGLALGEPVTVTLAPPEVRVWGPYQFPGLSRLPDGPLYWTRSNDNGRTWTKPAVFDDLGVWPQMLTLNNGVTLAVYGRPGLYVRATADPAGRRWNDRATIVDPGAVHTDTCSYAGPLPLSDDTALIAYSEFNLPGPEGRPCKGIRVRTVTATRTIEVPVGFIAAQL